MNAGGHGSDTVATLVAYRVVDLADGAGPPTTRRPTSAPPTGTPSVAATEVVVAATHRLAPGDPAAGRAAIDEIVRWRRANQPGGANAGSVFTNPAGDSAGRLIDACGLKGLRIGTAEVSPKHANFIQADRGGSADDVRRVMDQVRAVVAAEHRGRADHRGPDGRVRRLGGRHRSPAGSGRPTPDDVGTTSGTTSGATAGTGHREPVRRRRAHRSADPPAPGAGRAQPHPEAAAVGWPWRRASAALVVLGVVLLHTPLFGAKVVTVTGSHPNTTEAAILQAAGLVHHPPLISVDPAAAAARVEPCPSSPRPRSARHWPDGVTIP